MLVYNLIHNEILKKQKIAMLYYWYNINNLGTIFKTTVVLVALWEETPCKTSVGNLSTIDIHQIHANT